MRDRDDSRFHASRAVALRLAAALASAVAALVAGAALAPAAAAQESASFRMERIALAASAGEATGPTWGTRVSLAEPLAVGGMASVCGAAWVHTAGALSALAAGPVPIRLTVDRPSTDPLQVALSWSGTASAFDVRRVFDAATIADPGSVAETVGACSTVDPAPAASDLIFYLVVPAGTVPVRSLP